MCKACKMYGAELNVFRQRQGALEPDDFEKEVNYSPKQKKKNKKVRKTRPGCPGNDMGPHIYVYTTEYNFNDLFFRFYGYHKKERKYCAGCGKDGYKTQDTARYAKKKEREWVKRYGDVANVKRGEPLSRWGNRRISYHYWAWENYDEKYVAYKKQYLTQHGYTNIYWGNW